MPDTAEQYIIVSVGRIMVAVTIGENGVTIEHGTERITVECPAPQIAHTPCGTARVGASVSVDADGVATVMAPD